MSGTKHFTVEEIVYISSVLDNSEFKTRLAVIKDMELAATVDGITVDERGFIGACLEKLKQITDNDFNSINFLEAWALIDADEDAAGNGQPS